MDRRHFLDPRRLANLAGPLLGAADVQAEEPLGEAVHLRFARRAMATTFEVIVPFGIEQAQQLAGDVLDEIDRLESQLSVYRDSSEVSRLNARAHRHPVPVEPRLFELLTKAAQLHAATEGAFDIAVGALVKAWGFYRREGHVPPVAERQRVLERCGSRHLRLDCERQTVFYERAGLEINLGSIGKGYALDRAATLVLTPDLLLHGGHSSVLARGSEAPGRAGWTIGLLDPEQPERRRAVLRLRDRGMGTSAATYQHLEHEGRKLGHILDPRTGWPAEGLLSATATAPTAAEADALATAFFILGEQKAREFCDTHPDIGAVLTTCAAPQRLVVLGQALREIVG